MKYQNTLSFAQTLDEADPLHGWRKEFYFPQHKGANALYFTGNSLGLQPKRARVYVEEEMQKWEEFAVEGHFYPKEPMAQVS